MLSSSSAVLRNFVLYLQELWCLLIIMTLLPHLLYVHLSTVAYCYRTVQNRLGTFQSVQQYRDRLLYSRFVDVFRHLGPQNNHGGRTELKNRKLSSCETTYGITDR